MLVERFLHRWLNGYSYMGIGCSMSLTYPSTRISRADPFSIFEATALILPPGSDLEDLARKEPRLRLLGFVPDLQPVYNRAAAFVNPMRGGMGTRLKVLEAMAAGEAVVSTTLGAEGLDVTPGRELLLADSPAAFAETIQGLLADADRACEIGQAGRALVEARYRWETCLAPFEKVYKELSFRHG